MMGKSMSYVTCQVTIMTGFYMHVVLNKITRSPDPPLDGGLILVEATFDIMSRWLPLSGGLYHVQRTWPGQAS
jgi:hypothetical protein